MYDSTRICLQHRIYERFPEGLFMVRCCPQNATAYLSCKDDGKAGTDARACGYKYNGTEERGDTEYATGWYTPYPDVCGSAVDGTFRKVSGVADYKRKALAIGIGNCCKAVPVTKGSLGYWQISTSLRLNHLTVEYLPSRTAVPTTGSV